MRIISGYVNWNEGYANKPRLHFLVDKIPNYDDLIYEQIGSFYYAECDGLVNFFYYKEPDRGYGGREFNLKMSDGTIKTLIGPWSSNSMSINDAGFGPCVEVSLTDSIKAMELGYTFSSAAFTIRKILENQDKINIGKGYGIERPICNGKPFKFPVGSKFHLLWEGVAFEPSVILPDGSLWTKDEYQIKREYGESIFK